MAKRWVFLLLLPFASAQYLPNGCPEDIHIHLLLPHETDCDKFYYCNHGEKLSRNCPDGTLFDVNLQVCNWPQNVQCQPSIVTTTEPATTYNDKTTLDDVTTEIYEITIDYTDSNQQEQTTHKPGDKTTENELTTEHNTDKTEDDSELTTVEFTTEPTVATTLKPATDITTTIKTSTGDSNESTESFTDFTTVKTTAIDNETTETFDTTTENGVTTESTESTPEICPDGVFGAVSQPDKCDSYYLCTGWDPIQLFCPPGEEFDVNIGACTAIAEGGCTWQQSLTSTAIPEPTPDGPTIPTTSTTENETTTITSEPAVDLPTTPDSTLNPEVTESTYSPTTVEQTTENVETTTVDVDEITESSEVTTIPEETLIPGITETSTLYPTTIESEIIDIGDNSTNENIETTTKGISTEICPNGVFGAVPHPDKCDSYYLCTGWDPIQLYCPPGEEFDPCIGTCAAISDGGCTWGQNNKTSTTIDETTELTTKSWVTEGTTEISSPDTSTVYTITETNDESIHTDGTTKELDTTYVTDDPLTTNNPNVTSELTTEGTTEQYTEFPTETTEEKTETTDITEDFSETTDRYTTIEVTEETTSNVDLTTEFNNTEVTDVPTTNNLENTTLDITTHPTTIDNKNTTTDDTLEPDSTWYPTTTEKSTDIEEDTTEIESTPEICPNGVFGAVPHPDKCDSYYLCTGWDPIQLFCPPGEEFDINIGNCIGISESGCTWQQNQLTTPVTTNQPTTVEPTTDEPTTGGPTIDGPAIDGPAIDGPAIDGPATDAPGTGGATTDGPATDETMTDEPTTVEQTTTQLEVTTEIENPTNSTELPLTTIDVTESTVDSEDATNEVTTEQGTTVEVTEVCPDGVFGAVPHPDKCDSYYLCTGWDPIQLFCLPGEEFDINIGDCIVIVEGGCTWEQNQLTTTEGTTEEETTRNETVDPTTAEPTTADPITAEPTTADPITSEPTTADPITAEPTTADPITAEPTTADPITAEPTTADPITEEPTTADPTIAEPSTVDSTTAEPTTNEPTTNAVTTESAESTPEICPNGVFGAVPHPDKCDSYYLCTGWDPIQLFCPPGEEFDPSVGDCIVIAEGGCTWEQSQLTTTESTTEQQTMGDETVDPVTAEPTTADLTTAEPTTVDPTTAELESTTTAICPDGFFGTIAHPERCDTYYMCTGWMPIQLYCSADWEFDPEVGDCVKMSEGGCNWQLTSTSQPVTEIAATIDESETTDVDGAIESDNGAIESDGEATENDAATELSTETDDGATNPAAVNKAEVLCPEGYFEIIPDVRRCNSYFVSTCSGADHFFCSSGYEFDESSNKCVPISSDGCTAKQQLLHGQA